MAKINIDIEDYLDEVDEQVLFNELERRYKRMSKSVKVEFDDFVFGIMEDEFNSGWPDVKTMADEIKREYIKENWDKLSFE